MIDYTNTWSEPLGDVTLSKLPTTIFKFLETEDVINKKRNKGIGFSEYSLAALPRLSVNTVWQKDKWL